ncbi:MAG: hypothetical protein A2Y00_05800 [Omnitrophica WOR_2 bacterium GWF2_43_52]|nr:MAG: hypothetical protein A2062_04570 [Omnitrophica WOR_2 bacterium GWA2_44_7]OGX16517.1 MAG: hypothetical protein A2Y01_00225 [Omnitrophica WOR_2 bacterium GWC2_44_8]OGX20612.1 MAG: hypothetical protein A2Y00_05800 [Omnitrophica WOR_2 bacterium GWF2_43_52]OGX59041.1 MAG: hypothetical protein A2460_01555 [Omnitrophica WOR_2 bacterium RIFOXYC2_FULL_43_9]HAH21568.1 hypothetical protein [Candidatus Omnitrophota bacterium]
MRFKQYHKNREAGQWLFRSFMVALQVIIVTLGICGNGSWSSSEEIIDVEVPAPVEGKVVGTDTIAVLGREVRCTYYLSPHGKNSIAAYYQHNFSSEGFQQTVDKEISSVRQLRFKKLFMLEGKELVVEFVLSDKPNGTGVAIGKYTQPVGAGDIEKTPLSWREERFAPPKEDAPGEDLAIIPRPPESVRWMNIEKEKNVFLTYATSLSVEEVQDFYRNQMELRNWQVKRDFSAVREAVSEYKKVTKKKNIAVYSPFADGEDMEGIIADARALDFEGEEGKAKITIFPNFMDRSMGSVVQIFYEKAE